MSDERIEQQFTIAVVGNYIDGFTATVDGSDSPLRGWGSTPILALGELTSCIKQWPISGADRWLGTSASDKLRREVGAPPRCTSTDESS